jgi:micrococcal nuclease
MLRLVVLAVVLLTLFSAASSAQSADCADYDAWEWAQSIYDQQPSVRSGLDPDGNGIACDNLPRGEFAPAWWTDSIPTNVVEAQVVSVTDGDTLDVLIDGQPDSVRLYRADAPEVHGCGGDNATNFTRTALGYADSGATVYLESDATERDRYDRKLAYVWFEIDGQPYMLNEVLMRSGWAQDVDYGDRLYADEFPPAVQFAEKWQIGQWALCGGFGIDSAPQPDVPVEELPQEGPGAGNCDASYPSVCIPPIEVTGDLDCKQIDFRRFDVIPPDPHQFDLDYDGSGCEND